MTAPPRTIFDKARLSKEFRYWQSIAPTRAAEEAEARGGWGAQGRAQAENSATRRRRARRAE